MKRLALMVAAFLMLATSASANPVLGSWRTETGETGGYVIVEMAECNGGKICGTITDVVGNDNRSIIGRQIVSDMTAYADGSFSGGTIWAPDTDKTYKSDMELLSDNQLRVRGCVGICTALTSRSQVWTRQ
ncbi:MAG: DUF2147 domain-containing protein [Pseudomonadota bacterium]